MVYDKIIDYCKANGLSIMAFEKKCGLANAVVAKWENDRLKPSLSSLEKIAQATGIPIADWLKEER